MFWRRVRLVGGREDDGDRGAPEADTLVLQQVLSDLSLPLPRVESGVVRDINYIMLYKLILHA